MQHSTFSVRKADGKSWWPVHDWCAVNKAVFAWALVVPNPAMILSSVPGNAKWFSVTDLANAFFSIPIDLASLYWFAFNYKGKKYAWARAPIGFFRITNCLFSHVAGKFGRFCTPQRGYFNSGWFARRVSHPKKTVSLPCCIVFGFTGAQSVARKTPADEITSALFRTWDFAEQTNNWQILNPAPS